MSLRGCQAVPLGLPPPHPGSESAGPGAAGGEGASRGWPELPRGASWLSALQEVRLFERANHTWTPPTGARPRLFPWALGLPKGRAEGGSFLGWDWEHWGRRSSNQGGKKLPGLGCRE